MLKAVSVALAGFAAALGSTAALAQEPVTLTWAAHYTETEMAPLTACFREYERLNPGVTIRYQQSQITDFLQTILTSRIGGTSPDITNVYSIWGKQLVSSGILAEPPADMADFIRANYEASTAQSATVDGTLWGVPAEVSLYMLIYNKKLFAEAGIANPPTTWDEVLADAAKIVKKDANGKITQAGFAFGPTVANATHPFRALMFSAGLPLLKDDLSGTNVASPEAIKILEGEAALFSQGSTSVSNVVKDFPSGLNGMQFMANWYESELREAFGDQFEATVGVAPVPAGPDWKTYQYSFYQAVDANSPHQEAAWALIRWLNTPREAGKRSCTGDMLIHLGSLTANKGDIAASQAELGDAFTKPYIDALQGGRALTDPNITQTVEIDRVLRTAIESAWLGKASASDALTQADKEITDILAMP